MHCGDFIGSSQNTYTNASINLIDQLIDNIYCIMYFAELWILLHLLRRGKSAIRNWHLVLLDKPHANLGANGVLPNCRHSSMPRKTACYPINMPSPQHVPEIKIETILGTCLTLLPD